MSGLEKKLELLTRTVQRNYSLQPAPKRRPGLLKKDSMVLMKSARTLIVEQYDTEDVNLEDVIIDEEVSRSLRLREAR